MLSRLVRVQLVVFTVASMVGMLTMVFRYLSVPTYLGVGHIRVNVELPETGGLYRFGNVTYRGVQIGRVTRVEPTTTGAYAVLQIESRPEISADVDAHVRSASAVGEQYVDLVPRGDGPPFLQDGSVIPVDRTTVPQRVGPMLDSLSAMVGSVPKDKLSLLLGESSRAFGGAGYDIGSLIDSGSRLAADSAASAEPVRTLIEDGETVLDAQTRSIDSLATWSNSFAGITDQLVTNDPDLRRLLADGPGFADEVSRQLAEIKPTLPVLLTNMITLSSIGVTYNPSLRQVLVLLPPYIASLSSISGMNNSTGNAMGGFQVGQGDPPPCTAGFLPPSQWRSPDDETVIDTPDNLYCKLPQDSPISVRGIRNAPCMGHPGKRAPTVEICDSDRPYRPIAMRQHVLGPYPFDPNLISQGIPPDSRVLPDERTFLDPAGTPPPGRVDGASVPPEANASAAPPPPTPPAGAGPAAAPPNTPGAEPLAAVTQYDPQTGRYLGPDGRLYEQTNLTPTGIPNEWTDLLPR